MEKKNKAIYVSPKIVFVDMSASIILTSLGRGIENDLDDFFTLD